MFSLRKRKKTNLIRFSTYLVLGLSIILFQQFYPKQSSVIKMSIYSVVAPINSVLRQPSLMAEKGLSSFSSYFGAVKENKRLKEENAKLKSHYKHALVILAENDNLRYLLNMSNYLKYETVVANVNIDSSNLYASSLLVDLGEKDGIKPGFAVLTAEGVVGRVLEVNNGYSRVLLIDDYNTSIPVRVLESGVQGIIKGKNNPEKLTFITKEIGNLVEEGQHLVSSSVQGLFDDGMPVGVVSKVTNSEIEITPYANLNRIHKVLIVKR